jgi:TatD DNase family protein
LNRFDELIHTHQQLQYWENACSYLAPGLHPFYIEQHQPEHLQRLEQVQQHDCVVGEIGLDTFLKQHKQPEMFAKQQHYFIEQTYWQHSIKSLLLHIRKAHAETLAILKAQKFKLGGIAHAFSGGVEEAKALVKLGFKIGVTGQITNPNAKKLHQVVQAIGSENLVIETDCPDMTPLCCQTSTEHRTRNTPVNLPYVLESLAQTLDQPELQLAAQLWQNSLVALHLKF